MKGKFDNGITLVFQNLSCNDINACCGTGTVSCDDVAYHVVSGVIDESRNILMR